MRVVDERLDRVVDVKAGREKVVTAFTLHDAADILLNEWPAPTSAAAHRAARQAIVDAVEGKGTIRQARIAFERAAKAANIHVSTRNQTKQRDALREVMERLGHPYARRR